MSNEHKLYIKKKKINYFFIKFFQIFILIIFLLTWQLLSNYNIINSFIFSSPLKVFNCIIDLYKQNNLFEHIFITILETIISFSLGTIIGLIIASIMWWNKFLAKVIDPYLTILNSLPKVALGPILIIWAGAGMKSIIIMSLLISTIITIINAYEGFTNVDYIKIKLMKTFKASKLQIFLNLIIPANFKNIIKCLKINISMSLIGVIMGELLVSKKGLGYLIMYGSQIFNLDLVLTGTILLGLVSTLMYLIISKIEKKLVKN